ncbi:MAG: SDR family oxidoreductase [Acidobacteriota bacterium]|nr:SDR family oxidoreductase [Acidobacteriota bacterium]
MESARTEAASGRAAAGDWQGVPVLVTGGAGFIGSHLVDALVNAGADVRVLDNFATGRRENLRADGFELVEGDLRRAEDCRAAVAGRQVVFHQAALGSVPRSMADPATSLEVNVAGTARLFAEARDAGVERIVYASSSSVYGDHPGLPKVEGVEGKPLSPYALSKVMNEELAETFGRCFELRFIGLRYFNVYGPRQNPHGAYAAVIPRFFSACYAGEAPVIYGDGEQSRDFTFIDDAVAANLCAAGAPEEAWGRAYNVSGGREVTVNRLVELVRDLAGGPEPEYQQPRPGDVRASLADLSASRRLLGYDPQVVLEEGLQRTRAYYRQLSPASSP